MSNHLQKTYSFQELDRLNKKLSTIIELNLGGEEDSTSLINDINLFRRESPSLACPCLYEPGIVLICQGAKRMLIDGQSYLYDKNHFLLTTLDLPASTQVLKASHEEPCLGLFLRLDKSIIAEMIGQMNINTAHPLNTKSRRVVITERMTFQILEPIVRLAALTEEPDSIPILAPLIKREIYYHLLKSAVAPLMWNVITIGSAGNRITQIIQWIKQHYNEPVRIEKLARMVQMSPSSLHHHFRLLTGRTPLQYQKWLRLSEARRLMINERLDAATASYRVGYESPSHFNRDYKAIFGIPPGKDIQHVRSQNTLTL